MNITEEFRFLDLVSKMLKFDPLKRITPDEALNHPFFTQMVEFGMNTEFTVGPDLPD